MSDVTTTETVEVVVHVDRTLSDRRALTLIVSPGNVEIIVHPDVPVGTVDCLREELADAVANAVCAWPQSPNGWS